MIMYETEIQQLQDDMKKLMSIVNAKYKRMVELDEARRNYKPHNKELTELEYERAINGHYIPTWNSKTGPIKLDKITESHLLMLLPFLLKKKWYNWHSTCSMQLIKLSH